MSSEQSTLEDVFAPTPEPVDGQTPTRDLSALDKPGDCRSCGADVDSEVLRVVGRDRRVDACPRCFHAAQRHYSSAMEVARMAHLDPTWPRDLGGDE